MTMKKLIAFMLIVMLVLSIIGCSSDGEKPNNDTQTNQQTDSVSKDKETQQPDSVSKNEGTQPSSSNSESEKPSAKAELKYNTGYYSFEDLNDGFIDGRSLVFYDDGTVDYDWATYDYITVGDYKLEYKGKTIYMVAGPTGDTYNYTVSDDKITVVDWNGRNTVFKLTSDGKLKIEQTASEGFTVGKEYVMQ